MEYQFLRRNSKLSDSDRLRFVLKFDGGENIGRVLAMDVWRAPPFTFLVVSIFFRVAFSELVLRGVAPLDRPDAERQLRGKGVVRCERPP